MKPVTIRRENLAAIVAQAEREFPYECCGFVIGDGPAEQARPIRNIQNQKHADDPANHPRDARTAFIMDPKEHLAALEEVDRRKLPLKIVYHSHPDHDAYFSAEDRTQALGGWDEPNYPQAAQIVISVRGGEVRATKAFIWDAAQRDYVETSLVVE